MKKLKIVIILCVLAIFAISTNANAIEEYDGEANLEVHETILNSTTQKRIVIFFDGTGNDMQSRTNIIKLFNISANQNLDNIKFYYYKGVGTSFGIKLLSGVTGIGITPRVKDAYTFLSKNYTKDTKVYIFGFSRGAFTARVFSNFLDTVGLYDLSKINQTSTKYIVSKLYDKAFFKIKTKEEIQELSNTEIKKWKTTLGDKEVFSNHGSINIEILGLFDTVGALGYEILTKDQNFINPYEKYYFDQICNTKKVLHALSLDDNRAKIFTPIIISSNYITSKCKNKDNININEVVDEVWFSGAHSDIGGGYETNNSLSGVALNWMINKIKNIDPTLLPKETKVFENKQGYGHKASDEDSIIDSYTYGTTTRTEIINNYLKASVYKKLRVHKSAIDRISHIKDFSSKWYESDTLKECFQKTDNGYDFKKCSFIEVIE